MEGRREWEGEKRKKEDDGRKMKGRKWRRKSIGGGLDEEFSARWEMKLDRWYCACETFELNEREIFLLLGK